MDGNDDPRTGHPIEAHDDSFPIPFCEQRFHRASLKRNESAEGRLRVDVFVRTRISRCVF